MKKVKEIYYKELTKEDLKKHKWWSGLVFVLEDGTELHHNLCQDQVLEPFSPMPKNDNI